MQNDDSGFQRGSAFGRSRGPTLDAKRQGEQPAAQTQADWEPAARRPRGAVAWTVAWLVGAGPVAVTFASEETHDKPNLFTGDLGNVIWSLLTFGVVLLVLGKFAWKPILAALQKREEFIRDSLAQARRERENAERTLKEYADKLAAARAEASAIVDEGRRDAEVVKTRIEDHAKGEAQAMLDRAKREIGIAKDTAVKELYTLSAKLATLAAGKILRRELSAQEHERLIAESVAELETVE
ncbi:MAG: F0F1 ATP synthase subunit B [Planctomycetota bacterium]